MGAIHLRGLVLGLVAVTASAGTLSVPFTRQPLHQAMTLSRRDPINMESINNMSMGGYFAEFQIGTPPQTIHFQLDTGSSDTWVNTPSTDLCNSAYLQLQMGHCLDTFDPDESSTYESEENGDFDISYLDGRRIQGHYFNDTVTIGDVAVENQQLGLAVQSVRPTGLMGLGFSDNVAAEESYPTILDNLYTQGHINSRVFSLYLNEMDADSGTVLFGGIDSRKYIGDLAFLPLVADFQTPNASEIRSWSVQIERVRWRIDDETREETDADAETIALMDSGSTISLLPHSFAEAITSHYDTRKVDGLDLRFVDCNWRGRDGRGHNFEFVFDGKTISVPMSEMIIDAFSTEQVEAFSSPIAPAELRQVHEDFEGRVCMFGIDTIGDYGVRDDSIMILGDTFLRSSYVVYDMENKELALAQANVNEGQSNIVEVPANSTRVPRVSGVDRQTGAGDDDDDDDSSARSLLPSLSLGIVVTVVTQALFTML